MYFLYIEYFFSGRYLHIEKTVDHSSSSIASVEYWIPWKSYVNIYVRPAGNLAEWQAFL